MMQSPNISPAPASAVVERSHLAAAAKIVAMVAEKKATIPILTGARIFSLAGILYAEATDLDVSVRVKIGAGGDAIDSVVPADGLAKLLAKAKGDLVAIDCRPETLALDFGDGVKASWQRIGGPGDWPEMIPALDAPPLFKIAAADLREAFQRTAFCVSTEETRYYLNGVYAHPSADNERLIFVATDGHRAGVFHIPLPAGAEKLPSTGGARGVIIPSVTVNLLAKLIAKRDGEIQIALTGTDNNRLAFFLDETVVVTKIVDGTYPDYQRVFPANDPTKVFEFDADKLADAVERVSQREARPVRLESHGAYFTVSRTDPDSGATMVAEVPTSGPGTAMACGCNARYLRDALAQFKDCTVAIQMDANGPWIIRAAAPSRLAYLLMPMRI